MKLKEESYLMLLSANGMLVIIITILIQTADSKINEFNSKLESSDRLISNILTNQMLSATYLLKWNVIELLLTPSLRLEGIGYPIMFDNNEKQKFDQIMDEFEEGEIDDKRYVYELVELYEKQIVKLNKKYNEEIKNYNNLKENGTPWQSWKKRFLLIQTCLVFILIMGYIDLYRRIKTRTKKI